MGWLHQWHNMMVAKKLYYLAGPESQSGHPTKLCQKKELYLQAWPALLNFATCASATDEILFPFHLCINHYLEKALSHKKRIAPYISAWTTKRAMCETNDLRTHACTSGLITANIFLQESRSKTQQLQTSEPTPMSVWSFWNC